MSPVHTDHNDRNSCTQTTNLCRIDAPQFAVHVLTIHENSHAHFGVCGAFRRGAYSTYSRDPRVFARLHVCVVCRLCFGRGERDKEKRRQAFLWRQPLISVPLCTCVCVNQPLVSWRQMKQCASIRGSQNTHYPPRLFLYSRLCIAPPQPLFVTTAILKAIHAAPRLSSCIAAFSPAPRFLFFFSSLLSD